MLFHICIDTREAEGEGEGEEGKGTDGEDSATEEAPHAGVESAHLDAPPDEVPFEIRIFALFSIAARHPITASAPPRARI